MKSVKIEEVALKNVIPDENQPRKYFDPVKLNTLKASIKELGIKQPLTVQDMGSGKYLLIDRERRYRAAKELGLDSVPVIVEAPTSALQRLVMQFNIQEQHEGWTAVEKAEAIIEISKEMGLSYSDALSALNVPKDARTRYMAFASLSDRAGFQRSNVSVRYAPYYIGVRNATAKLAEDNNIDFDKSDAKKLENRLTQLILDGEVQQPRDLSKIKDSFTKNPKLITEFLTTKITADELYKKSKAKGAYYLRNALNNATYAASHARRFLEVRDVKMSKTQLIMLKASINQLEKLADLGSGEF